FHRGSRQNYVTPIDEKVTKEIVIPRGLEWPQGEDSVPQVRVRRLDANLGRPPVPHSSASFADERETGEKQPSRKKPDRDRVLGAEARQHEWGDLDGVVVEVEITEWPSPAGNPRGRVIEILGYEDDFGVDVEIIIRKFHLPHRFPVEVLQEAQQFDPVIPSSELRHRRDYRSLPIVTIDGETARDFDDAVTVRRMSNGHFELQVHIADVAHYVRESSSIDLEARLRGTSVYFPDRAVPMLPIELSTDLCSLRPQVDRMVLSCVMEIDHQGEIVGYTLNEGVIRSAERMTYTNVNLILEGDPAQRQHYHGLVDVFELMRELAMVLNRKRVRRGSIDFDLPEPVIDFDEHGLMKSITRSERNIANRIIEEFMLSANECVASYLENKHVGSLYRIHEKPEPRRVVEFEEIAAAFGYSLGVGNLPVKTFRMKGERREHRQGGSRTPRNYEVTGDIPITPRMYQKLTVKISGKPEERILSYLMLRSLRQARYSEKNEGHFALAAPCYTHFTSPIRRYPDLIVHRITKALLDAGVDAHGVLAEGEPHAAPHKKHVILSEVSHSEAQSKDLRPARGRADFVPVEENELRSIGQECSENERRAADAERELVEWKKIKFMRDRIGEDFSGMILNATKYGLFVELDDLFVEGLVPIQTLGAYDNDHYTYRENTRQIIGDRWGRKFSVGERVRVVLDRIDAVEKRLQFSILDEQESILARQPGESGQTKKKKPRPEPARAESSARPAKPGKHRGYRPPNLKKLPKNKKKKRR
ncbi:MAG: RNB domain-containing ribonuclease, partial [Acidobacteriaceae bacterium]